jgi:hypothetical protein
MNRTDFQQLAQMRLRDVEVLLNETCFAAAYYLCGYVVECGLKACIAKQTRRHDFPPDRNTINEIYTHDLDKLVKSAGLKTWMLDDFHQDPVLDLNWAIVKEWKEDSRYDRRGQQEAADLYRAVSDNEHGVLQWISRYW